MTKRHSKVIGISFCIILVIYFLLSSKKNQSESIISSKQDIVKKYHIDLDNLELEGRKVIGLPVGKEKESISKIRVVNRPTAHWNEGLEKALRSQGGDDLKKIELKSIDSFVWSQDGISLFVESVIVTIKKNNNEETSFRVLVDSETGKILKNWDQPVYDPMNPRDNFKIKIDPRYHSDTGH